MNSVNIIGRVARDPLDRETVNGVPCSLFSVAINRAGGQTVFVDVVAYRSAAQFVNGYVTRGRLIGITGHLNTWEWTDDKGENRRTVQVVADRVYALDKPGGPRESTEEKQE
jgi:single-strand DNA-binding protein